MTLGNRKYSNEAHAHTTIHSSSNKQHDGFLGHACLGHWVNLGAGTNDGDIRNNHGSVKDR
jgi:hypothetical protein